MITQDELKKILSYNPETGDFHWINKPNKKLPAGYKAGCSKSGYVRIHYKDHAFGAHRLAWLYVYGEHPKHLIDHINGDPLDNRIANLREATTFENAQNIKKPQKNNSHGTLGISYVPNKKLWRARIGVNGKRIYIGKYKSQEDAAQAYLEAKRKYHPFNTL
jgi:hypothetical protein